MLQHNSFSKNNVLRLKYLATHYFLKYCVVRHVRNTIFFQNIVLCEILAATHYFSKKKYCIVAKNSVVRNFSRNTLFFSKNSVL